MATRPRLANYPPTTCRAAPAASAQAPGIELGGVTAGAPQAPWLTQTPPPRDCPWAYAHPEKCVQRLAPTWIRQARARHDSLRVPPGMRLGRASDPAML